jgi:hypothetical protein
MRRDFVATPKLRRERLLVPTRYKTARFYVCLGLLQRGAQVGLRKIATLAEHRFAFVAGERVAEAVAEIQISGVS